MIPAIFGKSAAQNGNLFSSPNRGSEDDSTNFGTGANLVGGVTLLLGTTLGFRV